MFLPQQETRTSQATAALRDRGRTLEGPRTLGSGFLAVVGMACLKIPSHSSGTRSHESQSCRCGGEVHGQVQHSYSARLDDIFLLLDSDVRATRNFAGRASIGSAHVWRERNKQKRSISITGTLCSNLFSGARAVWCSRLAARFPCPARIGRHDRFGSCTFPC